MKKITNFFYLMLFLALSLPAKAFGMADLYGPPNVQIKYGPPTQPLYGVYPDLSPVDRITIIGRWAAVILIPIALIVLIILGIRKLRKKK